MFQRWKKGLELKKATQTEMLTQACPLTIFYDAVNAGTRYLYKTSPASKWIRRTYKNIAIAASMLSPPYTQTRTLHYILEKHEINLLKIGNFC